MAKKEKVQLTPEELAAKKLKTKKGWARFGAVVLALAITLVIYKFGAKDGHKINKVEAQTVVETVTVKKTEATTKAAETTTKAAETTTKADDSTTKKAETTTAASSSSILDSIKDGLSGLISGGSSSLPSVDGESAASAVEKVGSAAQDFFYGLADKVEQTTTAQ